MIAALLLYVGTYNLKYRTKIFAFYIRETCRLYIFIEISVPSTMSIGRYRHTVTYEIASHRVDDVDIPPVCGHYIHEIKFNIITLNTNSDFRS